MGTLIANKGLGIEFEIEDKTQAELEAYERELGRYLTEAGFSGSEDAVAVSAVTRGAIDVGWIPPEVLTKDQVALSKPGKIAFLGARIMEFVDKSKQIPEDFSLDLEIPEILQGDLEKYENIRSSLVKNVDLTFYETSLSNAILVRASIRAGWIPDDILTEDQIGSSKPYLIRHLANEVTVALTEARFIPKE